MRRTQSVRHHTRSATALAADDLGMVRENEETLEDVLRAQMLEKEKENDKLKIQIAQLKSQLAERPPLETVQELRKEYTNLEILLDGTQRENERCMSDLERAKAREKSLESQLEKLVGPNWQANLEIAPSSMLANRQGFMSPGHVRTNSMARQQPTEASPADSEANKAFIEQVRLLVLGMEQRLQNREEKLLRDLEKAEGEGAKFEEMKRKLAIV